MSDAIQFRLFDPPDGLPDDVVVLESVPGDEPWLFPDSAHEEGLLPPRPYQRDVIGKITAAWREHGITRQVIAMPTGSGKTVVAAHVVREARLPALFMVHRDILVEQTRDKVASVNPDLKIGLVKAESNDWDAPFVIASAQTLAHESRLEALHAAFPTRRLLISDECHHDLGPSRRRAIERLAPTLLLGFTATPQRTDGQGLDALYQEVTAHLGLIDLMARGVLARATGIRIETTTVLDDVPSRDGDFAQDRLARAVDTPSRNQLIVDTWKARAADRRSTTVFCASVLHAQHVAECFRENGVPCQAVWGEMPMKGPEGRLAVLEDYEAGRLKVIANRDVLTEGWDSPVTDCLLLARPTKSRPLYIQIVGRGLRISPSTGKRDLLVIDFTDATRKHQLVTLPSLASSDRLEEGPLGQQYAALDDEPDPDERAPGEPLDLLDYARVRQRRAVDVDLLAASPFIWRALGACQWATLGDGAYLVLRRERAGYMTYQVQEGGRQIDKWGYPRRDDPTVTPLYPRPIPDFGYAMGMAEARGQLELDRKPYLRRTAQWRLIGLPPTEKQRALAAKLRIAVAPGETMGSLGTKIDESLFGRVWRKAEPLLPSP